MKVSIILFQVPPKCKLNMGIFGIKMYVPSGNPDRYDKKTRISISKELISCWDSFGKIVPA
jgi:hypothetical protein